MERVSSYKAVAALAIGGGTALAAKHRVQRVGAGTSEWVGCASQMGQLGIESVDSFSPSGSSGGSAPGVLAVVVPVFGGC